MTRPKGTSTRYPLSACACWLGALLGSIRPPPSGGPLLGVSLFLLALVVVGLGSVGMLAPGDRSERPLLQLALAFFLAGMGAAWLRPPPGHGPLGAVGEAGVRGVGVVLSSEGAPGGGVASLRLDEIELASGFVGEGPSRGGDRGEALGGLQESGRWARVRWRRTVTARLPRGAVVREGEKVLFEGRLRWGERLSLSLSRVASAGQGASPLLKAAIWVRNRVRQIAIKTLPREEAGLLLGLTLGETGLMGREAKEAYRTTGLTHLTAVSGANVAYVLTTAFLAARIFGLRRGLRRASATCVIWFFAAVTRFEPSVLRATVMASLGLAGEALGRRIRPEQALSSAVVLLLLVDPGLSRSFGFLLSVAATAGIVFLGGVEGSEDGERSLARIPQRVGTFLRTTLAAQLAVAPLIWRVFGRVSLVSVVANGLVAPAAGPGTVAGLLSFPLSLVGLGSLPLLLARPLLVWMLKVPRSLAALPLAEVRAPPPPAWFLLLWYSALALLAFRERAQRQGPARLGESWWSRREG